MVAKSLVLLYSMSSGKGSLPLTKFYLIIPDVQTLREQGHVLERENA